MCTYKCDICGKPATIEVMHDGECVMAFCAECGDQSDGPDDDLDLPEPELEDDTAEYEAIWA